MNSSSDDAYYIPKKLSKKVNTKIFHQINDIDDICTRTTHENYWHIINWKEEKAKTKQQQKKKQMKKK